MAELNEITEKIIGAADEERIRRISNRSSGEAPGLRASASNGGPF